MTQVSHDCVSGRPEVEPSQVALSNQALKVVSGAVVA